MGNVDIFEKMRMTYNKIMNRISDLQHEQMDLLRRIQIIEKKLNDPKFGDTVDDQE